MHLIPLIKNKLLVKTPNEPRLNLDDKMHVNYEYQNNAKRVKIGVLVSKNAKSEDNHKTQSKVEDDRRFTIDASIMKVMKSRRRIDY